MRTAHVLNDSTGLAARGYERVHADLATTSVPFRRSLLLMSTYAGSARVSTCRLAIGEQRREHLVQVNAEGSGLGVIFHGKVGQNVRAIASCNGSP